MDQELNAPDRPGRDWWYVAERVAQALRHKMSTRARPIVEARPEIEVATGFPQCKDGGWHHIGTNKNNKDPSAGGPWTPVFADPFTKAGLTLDDPPNKAHVECREGPHSKRYHREVYRRLMHKTLDSLPCTPKIREAFRAELGRMRDEPSVPNSASHRRSMER